jgi:chemotaxis protein CheZ
MTPEELKARYGNLVLNLSAALEAGDETAFSTHLNSIARDRDDGLWLQLRKLTTDLGSALERFQLDSRLVDLAEKEVPDAKHRLDYVMKMTDEAAHKTMDLVEQSGPLAGRISSDAEKLSAMWQQFRNRQISPEDFRAMLDKMEVFLDDVRSTSEQLRKNLAEVLMTQGYQDLSGQIIRGVIKLVDEVESTLGHLVHLATSHTGKEVSGDKFRESRGHGPAVPGVDHGNVVNGQQDIDALLSGLGI